MRFPRRLLVPIIASVVMPALGAPLVSVTLVAQSPAATLARAVATYRAAKTMRVRFDQMVSNPLTGTELASRGELLRKKPNLLSIDFSDPAHDAIVADGKSLWVYLPSSAPGQVIKLPASGSPGALIDPLGQILSASTDQYTLADAGTSTVGGRTTRAVTMTPKQKSDVLFTRATVWVDQADGTVRQIEATEPSGVTRKIVITKFTPNVAIPAGTFTFTPPPNVRVVDGQTGH